ncbi:MAG: complex I NDUFA9 subunit family protein [Nitrospinota bacterium]
MKVFVAGGTGFVGLSVVAKLLETGHEVICLARNPEKVRLPLAVSVLKGDATEPKGLADKLKGADAVINLIGIIRSYHSRGITFRKLHVEATQNLLKAAQNSGIKRFIQMSANGAARKGITEYQRTKYEAEVLVKSSGMDWTIFRPSLIFGPPSAGKMEFCTQISNILRRSPFAPVFGNGEYRLQPIHLDDVTSCFALAVDNPEAVKRIFHLGGRETISYNTILDIICIAMNIPVRRKIYVPWFTVRPLVALMGSFSFFPVTHYQIEMLMQGNTVPEMEYRKVFGVSPKEFSSETLSYLRTR